MSFVYCPNRFEKEWLSCLQVILAIEYDYDYPLETDIDDYANHSCKNNGTCTERVNGFKYSCVPGFSGKLCETDNNIQN